jgi:hypothetical protein
MAPMTPMMPGLRLPEAALLRKAPIDRSVLGAWLDEGAAIDALLVKFRETMVGAEREIDAASRTGDFPKLAAAAHRLKGAAQAVGASAPPWSRRAKPATEHAVWTCWAVSRCNCAAPVQRSMDLVDQRNPEADGITQTQLSVVASPHEPPLSSVPPLHLPEWSAIDAALRASVNYMMARSGSACVLQPGFETLGWAYLSGQL